MRDKRAIRLCTKPVSGTARTLVIIAAIVSVAMSSYSSNTTTPSAENPRSSDAPVEAGWESVPNRLAGFQVTGPPDMVWVPGGEFEMGWDGSEGRYDERPAHRVRVDGFWMDTTEVTNAQFREFVEATGYVTTAEQLPDWEELKKQLPPGTPKPPDGVLVAGSVVFTPSAHPVDLRDHSQWWTWTPDADWRHPEGPGSSIDGRDNYPVIHVAWEDAAAYGKWAGKRLPTEAEWERAARYGHDGHRYAWGDELTPGGRHRANIWQGTFPHHNTADDGFERAAPVKSFPPNAIGARLGNRIRWG